MNPNSLRSHTIPEARALAHHLGACECHHDKPRGGSLHEDVDRIIERYESDRCACYRLIKELTPEQAREAVALYLLGRDMSWDKNERYHSSENLEHFWVQAGRYESIRVLRYIYIEEKLNIALDYLEGVPRRSLRDRNPQTADPILGSGFVDIED